MGQKNLADFWLQTHSGVHKGCAKAKASPVRGTCGHLGTCGQQDKALPQPQALPDRLLLEVHVQVNLLPFLLLLWALQGHCGDTQSHTSIWGTPTFPPTRGFCAPSSLVAEQTKHILNKSTATGEEL